MAKIAATPVLFKAPVSLGTDEYTAHLNKAEFVPTQPTASVTDLDGKVTNFGGKSGWILDMAGFQDWSSANTLAAYLTAHEGEEIDVTVGPDASGATHAGKVIAAAVNKGGTINTPAQWAKQLPCNGDVITTYPEP